MQNEGQRLVYGLRRYYNVEETPDVYHHDEQGLQDNNNNNKHDYRMVSRNGHRRGEQM